MDVEANLVPKWCWSISREKMSLKILKSLSLVEKISEFNLFWTDGIVAFCKHPPFISITFVPTGGVKLSRIHIFNEHWHYLKGFNVEEALSTLTVCILRGRGRNCNSWLLHLSFFFPFHLHDLYILLSNRFWLKVFVSARSLERLPSRGWKTARR